MPEAKPKQKHPRLRGLRAAQLAKLAWSLVEAQRPSEALPLLEMAVDLQAKNAELWAALGMARARALLPQEAISAFDRALALEPLAPRALELWCAVGELSLERFDYKLAAFALQKCLQLDPAAQHGSGVRARALIRKAQKQIEKRA